MKPSNDQQVRWLLLLNQVCETLTSDKVLRLCGGRGDRAFPDGHEAHLACGPWAVKALAALVAGEELPPPPA